MEDLNEFFAKKDKKKSKGIKFATLNEIDRKLQQTDRKREKYLNKNKDDDWKDFEEKKTDYTGLKIHNTNINDNEDDVTDTEEISLGDAHCAWKDMEQPKDLLVNTELNKLQEVVVKPPVWKLSTPNVGTYVPPHLRNKPKLLNNRNLNPISSGNVNNESLFPELPFTSQVNGSWPKSWKEVKGDEAKENKMSLYS